MPEFSDCQRHLADIRECIILVTANDDDEVVENLAELLLYIVSSRYLSDSIPLQRTWCHGLSTTT